MSGDLILGDYLIYWLCGEVWLIELRLFKVQLWSKHFAWTNLLFACRRGGNWRKKKDLGTLSAPRALLRGFGISPWI